MTTLDGWVDVRLDDVADVRLGRQRSPDKAHGENLVPYLRAANVRWGGLDLSDVKTMQFSTEEVRTFQLRRGDILVVEASGSQGEVGKSALWNEELPLACLQNTLIRVRSRGADPTFLRWRLHFDAVTGGLGGASKGVGIYHIGAERLSSWQLGLPPLNEQRRIVTKLDAIFEQTRAAKVRLERLPALLEKLKCSILSAAFRGDLTKDWRAAHPDCEPAGALLNRIRAERRCRWEDGLRAKGKDLTNAIYESYAPDSVDKLPSLPRGWAWAGLSEVAELQLGQRRAPEYKGETEFPYVRAANITWRGLDLSDVKTMGFVDTERLFLRRGDVVLSEASGSAKEVGKPGLWRDEIPNCCFQATVLRLRPDPSTLGGEWLYLSCLADAALGRFAAMAPGVGILHLTAERMRKWPVPVAPIAEQKALSLVLTEALARVYAAEDRASGFAQRIEQLEKSALAKAFSGELVPQDPTDEPASVLLDRIRVARATAPGWPRRGRGQRGDDTAVASTTSTSEHVTNGHHDESLDLVVGMFQIDRRLTTTAITSATGLDAAAVRKALKILVATGQVRVHSRPRNTTYEWSA